MNALGGKGLPFVFLISFSGEGNLVIPMEEAAGQGFCLAMPGMVNHDLPGMVHKDLLGPVDHDLSGMMSGPVQFRKSPVEKGRYREAFNHVKEQILYGNSFLLNLTFPTRVETNMTLREVFARSRAPFRLYLEDELVVFSPERFVRVDGRSISSNPMKGTMDAGIAGAHEKLLSDPKEDAEHNTIVDLIRNDLSIIASGIRVKRFKYVEKVRTHRGDLLQMSSEITGILPEDYQGRLGQLFFSLLPAGSISGAPKSKTVEIIRQAEGYDRGYYTGVFGYWDGRSLDSAVAIRYMERDAEGLLFKSGGGITFLSDCEKEYEEMLNKVYVPIY